MVSEASKRRKKMALLDVLRTGSQNVQFLTPSRDHEAEEVDLLMSERLLLPNNFNVSLQAHTACLNYANELTTNSQF